MSSSFYDDVIRVSSVLAFSIAVLTSSFFVALVDPQQILTKESEDYLLTSPRELIFNQWAANTTHFS